MNCTICGTGPAEFKFRKEEYEVLECSSCGLVFWAVPENHHAEAIYDSAYFDGVEARRGFSDYAAMEPAFRHSFRRRTQALGPPPEGGCLLDVGAAYGFAVSEASRAGWNAIGVEISTAAARHARDVTGARIAVGNSKALPFASESIDVITMWDVLEHVADLHRSLDELHRILRPGGRLVLTTTDVGSLLARVSGSHWHFYNFPEHINFFTRHSLAILLANHRFEVDSMGTDRGYFSLGYLVERVRKVFFGHTGAAADWPGARITIPVNLFDTVTVQARRAA